VTDSLELTHIIPLPYQISLPWEGSLKADPSEPSRRTGGLYNYFCQLCGKRWEWREDQPYPYPAGTALAANANELLRMGAQRLEEEEAARQREYDEWTMWHIHQQRSK
jgi:hypothetical protein